MCGIAAIIGIRDFRTDPAQLRAMADSLVHRGPDDHGYYVEGRVGLALRRLAILDLTPSGHQPMVSHDGRHAMVFNGEIFNYAELRDELKARGRSFSSTGDSEVLLAAYQEWGEACLDRLNGMFAFIVHDRQSGVVFAARDRFGVKPLYICRSGDAFLLASEIKAIRAVTRPAVNWRSASRYLVHGQLDDTAETFFQGIEQFPAGACMTIAPDGTTRRRTWWHLPPEQASAPADMIERYAELFEDSVRLRMRSDVPVGVLLSGGMDSTSIMCSMTRHRAAEGATRPPLAFSYNVKEFDESPYIQATLEQTGAELVPLTGGGGDFWGRLSRVIAAQDEPTHSFNVLAQDGLMQLARQHGAVVVLTGEGADETTAGYDTYFRDYWYALLKRGRAAHTLREISAFAAVHGGSVLSHGMALLRTALFRTLGRFDAYRHSRLAARRSELGRHPWFDPDLASQAELEVRRPPGNLEDALREAVEVSPLPLYLRVADRVSMAHSVEARDPFLDYRLVSFTFSLPFDVKLKGPWNKWLLREAMRGRIPEVVRTRADKFGFPVPTPAWVRDGFYQPARETLSSAQAAGRGVYRVGPLLADLDRVHQGHATLPPELIRAIQFELWAGLAGAGSATGALPATGGPASF